MVSQNHPPNHNHHHSEVRFREENLAATKKRQSIDNSMIRSNMLDGCAHFHYETSELDDLQLSLIQNESYRKRISLNDNELSNINIFIRVQCSNRSWTVRRDLRDFKFLDSQLHKCIFDRQHSKLKKIDESTLTIESNTLDTILYHLEQYLERLSSLITGSSLTCGPILHWFEMDNHGNRLINEDSDINTPAIGAAFVIKEHSKKDVETEISLEIGELISVIEMPPLNESFYWKGKKGFQVGFFPAECVQLIDDQIGRTSGDKLSSLRPLNKCVSPSICHRSQQQADTLNNSLSDTEEQSTDNAMESAINKRSKISALLRNFVAGIRTRRRDELKRSGILKERVFGCDLCEHLENSGHEYPLVLTTCCEYIEQFGLYTNGIYRISGVMSTINRLRAIFDEDRVPLELINCNFNQLKNTLSTANDEPLDIHAVGSLLKLYFRELPNPLLTYSLFDSFISAMREESLEEEQRINIISTLIHRLPPPHLRTLRYLIKHLALISQFHEETGMTTKNIAIVWAPNLLRTKQLDLGKEALQIISTQAILTEFIISNCDKIFDSDEFEIQPGRSLYSPFVDRHEHSQKSPPLSSKCVKYIDVGPGIVPGKFHTVILQRPQTTQSTKRYKFNLNNLKLQNLFQSNLTAANRREHRSASFIRSSSSSSTSCSSNRTSSSSNHLLNRQQHKQKVLNLNNTKEGSSLCNQWNVSSNVKYSASKILCCSTNSSSNRNQDGQQSVKRSQSFDSYFKKLMKTQHHLNNINNVDCDDSDDHSGADDNNNNNDDKRNVEFRKKILQDKTILYADEDDEQENSIIHQNHRSLTEEIILEVEEKDCLDASPPSASTTANDNGDKENNYPSEQESESLNTSIKTIELNSDMEIDHLASMLTNDVKEEMNRSIDNAEVNLRNIDENNQVTIRRLRTTNKRQRTRHAFYFKDE